MHHRFCLRQGGCSGWSPEARRGHPLPGGRSPTGRDPLSPSSGSISRLAPPSVERDRGEAEPPHGITPNLRFLSPPPVGRTRF
jgi:hypothetical protein